jgi:large subunit ribosomal protein L10
MRPEKTILVEHIQNVLDESENFLLVSYMGLSVEKQEKFKSLLREKNATFQVHKNKLIQKAAEGKGYKGLSDITLEGGTGIIYGEGEPSAWAKVVKEFGKENEEVVFKAAFVEGEILDAGKAKLVAELPTKNEARALLLSAIISGPQQLVGILNTSVSGLATVIKNYTDKQNES